MRTLFLKDGNYFFVAFTQSVIYFTYMQHKRTGLDFSKHIVEVTASQDVSVHFLRVPGTVTDSVKFINTHGILAVTGDYGNWMFCREFLPGPKECVSDGYWVEKLKIASKQNPFTFDSETARKEVQELRHGDYEWSEEEFEWLDELYDAADDGEYSFISKLMDYPSGFDTEMMPSGKKIDYWLLVVFDAFDEICRRMKEQEKAK